MPHSANVKTPVIVSYNGGLYLFFHFIFPSTTFFPFSSNSGSSRPSESRVLEYPAMKLQLFYSDMLHQFFIYYKFKSNNWICVLFKMENFLRWSPAWEVRPCEVGVVIQPCLQLVAAHAVLKPPAVRPGAGAEQRREEPADASHHRRVCHRGPAERLPCPRHRRSLRGRSARLHALQRFGVEAGHPSAQVKRK